MTLQKVLKNFDKEFNGTCNHEGKTRIDYEEINNLKQFIKSEIKNALKEVVPNEQREYSFDNQEFPECKIFNNCRQQLLSNIKKYINN